MMKQILVVDDNEHILSDLGNALHGEGYGIHKASSLMEAKSLIVSQRIDLAIVDIKIDYRSGFGGVELLNLLKRQHPRAKTIILSGYEKLDAVAEMKLEEPADAYISKTAPGNYIANVLEKLKQLDESQQRRSCFVIMPISRTKSCTAAEWTEVFEKMIVPAVTACGPAYRCVRAKPTEGNILEGIMQGLNGADIVVADLTDRNPNVFYELGVRHALRGSTVLIAQDMKHVPFDLQPHVVLLYKWKVDRDREEFKEQFRQLVAAMDTNPRSMLSPVQRYMILENEPSGLRSQTGALLQEKAIAL